MSIKRIIAAVFIIFTVSVTDTFAQALLNPEKYLSAFPLKTGENVFDNDFVWAADNESYERFAALNGRDDLIDTPLEFALLSYYSPSVMGMRPAGATAILPANNPRISGLKLSAAVHKELTELRFFESGNKAAIEKYETMLHYISEKNNISRQQIEQYYRSGIRGLVSEIVDEEFNKVSFSLTNFQAGRTYYCTIIRIPRNGRYTLNYEKPSITNAAVKTISAAARESLLNEMRRRTDEFDQADIDKARAQAALIPAVAFPAAVRDDVVNVTSAFLLNPDTGTYNALEEKWRELFDQKEPGQVAASSFSRILVALNEALVAVGQQD